MTAVERRRSERNGSAVIRALGRTPSADYRAQQLRVNDVGVGIATPYLLADPSQDDAPDDVVSRGVVDAIAVRLRHSDGDLFAEHEPEDVVARIIFDMLEQLRCESLVPDALAGTRNNIERAFRAWCLRERLSSTAIGILIFTVMHMVRARLIAPIHDELIEDRIESTRALISPIIGVALKGLREHREDQTAYVVPALSIAEAIAEMVLDSSADLVEQTAQTTAALFIPPEWGEDDSADGEQWIQGVETVAKPSDREALETIGGYRVFTTTHDVELRGGDLYSAERLRELRVTLDEQIAAQSVSAFTLARRVQRLFVGFAEDGWRSGEEEGFLDPARLGQVVANPGNHNVFRKQRLSPIAPAVVSFLIDNSGSMKRQRHQSVTVLVDTLARALDLAGATSEILGFTTNAWNGGEALREWRRAGEPGSPGRLAERSHIIYKDADTPWKRSRHGVAAMMRAQHFREGIDGEAIVWAYERLLARPEPRKVLVVFSDGAPMEAATINANGESFLESHLQLVVQQIERAGVVQIGAATVDQSVEMIYSNTVGIDLTGTLSLSEYQIIEKLFARR